MRAECRRQTRLRGNCSLDGWNRDSPGQNVRTTSGRLLGRSGGPGLSQTGIAGLLRARCLPIHSCVSAHIHTIASDTQQKFHAILPLDLRVSSVCPSALSEELCPAPKSIDITSPRATPPFPSSASRTWLCGRRRNSICGCPPLHDLHPVSMAFLRMGPAQCELELIWAGSPLCVWPHPVTFSE